MDLETTKLQIKKEKDLRRVRDSFNDGFNSGLLTCTSMMFGIHHLLFECPLAATTPKWMWIVNTIMFFVLAGAYILNYRKRIKQMGG